MRVGCEYTVETRSSEKVDSHGAGHLNGTPGNPQVDALCDFEKCDCGCTCGGTCGGNGGCGCGGGGQGIPVKVIVDGEEKTGTEIVPCGPVNGHRPLSLWQGASGNYFRSLELDGHAPLIPLPVFYYNSANNGKNLGYGFGWIQSYHQTISVVNTTTVDRLDGSGAVGRFTNKDASGYYTCRPSRKSCRDWMRRARSNDLLQCGGWTAEECSLCSRYSAKAHRALDPRRPLR